MKRDNKIKSTVHYSLACEGSKLTNCMSYIPKPVFCWKNIKSHTMQCQNWVPGTNFEKETFSTDALSRKVVMESVLHTAFQTTTGSRSKLLTDRAQFHTAGIKTRFWHHFRLKLMSCLYLCSLPLVRRKEHTSHSGHTTSRTIKSNE